MSRIRAIPVINIAQIGPIWQVYLMKREWRMGLGWVICGLGVLIALIGLWAVGAYVWGVMSVWGESDRSWIFWGLAILFIGLGGVGLGIGLIVAGRSLINRGKS